VVIRWIGVNQSYIDIQRAERTCRAYCGQRITTFFVSFESTNANNEIVVGNFQKIYTLTVNLIIETIFIMTLIQMRCFEGYKMCGK
jgi:hypothetical protein